MYSQVSILVFGFLAMFSIFLAKLTLPFFCLIQYLHASIKNNLVFYQGYSIIWGLGLHRIVQHSFYYMLDRNKYYIKLGNYRILPKKLNMLYNYKCVIKV